VKDLEYAFSQVQTVPLGGISFTNNENTNMIEHEVVLHHLAAHVKGLFDGALVKCGVHGAPGMYDQITILLMTNLN